jgi:hypothetical protein
LCGSNIHFVVVVVVVGGGGGAHGGSLLIGTFIGIISSD